MKARKFGYDVASARTTLCTPTTYKPMPNVRLFSQEGVRPLASCEAEITKESIETKAENVSASVLFYVLSLDYLSCPQIWNIEKEKDREKEKVGRQASEAQREKELERERKKIKRRHFLLEEQNEVL